MSSHAMPARDGGGLPLQIQGIIALLSTDERPTLILQQTEPDRQSHIIYSNTALQSLITDHHHLEAWAQTIQTQIPQHDDNYSTQDAGRFCGRSWTSKSIVDTSFTVVYCAEGNTNGFLSGSTSPAVLNNSHAPEVPGSAHQVPVVDYTGDKISEWYCDWIHDPSIINDEWFHFLITYDWQSTELGSIQDWPQDLRRLAIYILSAPDPRFILWGDDLLGLFNNAARPMLGERYLDCLGRPLSKALGASVVQQDLEALRRSLKNGTAIKETNVEYVLHRYGMDEECYFDFHIAPLAGENGYLCGAVIEFRETTATVISDRKTQVATAMFDEIAGTKDHNTFWSCLVHGLTYEPKYISCALVYTKVEGTDVLDTYHLQASAGVDASSLIQSVKLDDWSQTLSLGAVMRDAGNAEKVSVLHHKDGALPAELAIDVDNRGVISTAAIMPVQTGPVTNRPTAFVIIGMNPKLDYKDDDRNLADHLRDVVSRSYSVIAHPDPHSREQDLEMLNQDLAKKLKLTTRQFKKSEQAFTRMASNAPFGIYSFQTDGTPVFVNETWLSMCGFSSREEFETQARLGSQWRESLYLPEDLERMDFLWNEVLTAHKPSKYEHRLLIPDHARRKSGREYQWVEAISFPEFDEDGKVIAMKGWLLDISDRKRAEELMAKNLHDALETKQASERFIDMVSHEIRNPLSAILQLADGLLNSAKTSPDAEAIIDAASTVVLCTNHMRKIVTDVLVLSKLDSNLLVLSPDKCRPPLLIEKALKIHETELARADIKASLSIEPSYHELGIDSVLLDEGRVLQVMINLLGNAIKFTQGPHARQIHVHLAASETVPTGDEYQIKFAEPRHKRPSIQRSESSHLTKQVARDALYLQIAVRDTGRGLAPDEIERLFQRFSQASPKTYKKYGGTGLGLYISKELTELQGGQIGVKSDGLGKGTCFAFYVKCWRTTPATETPSLEASVAVKEVTSPEQSEATRTVLTKTRSIPEKASTVSSLHVLVVEDNAINQKVMAQQLRRVGCTVHVANHGIECLSFLSTTVFQAGTTPLDIVLMDVEMPVLSGLGATERIRQLEGEGKVSGRVPIIAVTANARDGQIAEALAAGMDEVVTKPFRIPEIVPRMERLVERLAGGGRMLP